MKKKLFALLMALVMVLSLAACGGDDAGSSADNGGQTAGDTGSTGGDTGSGGDAAPAESGLKLGYSLATNTSVYGPYWDEWSDMTDEELYQKALEEVKEYPEINIYATSSKMMKAEEDFEEAYPGLDIVIMDMDQDEVLEKCVLEADSGNI